MWTVVRLVELFHSVLLYFYVGEFDMLLISYPTFFAPVRSSVSSTVLRRRGILPITRTSSSRSCVPMSATTCAWAENSWTRSPRRLSETPGAACRRDVTWTWCTTSARTSLTPTSLVRFQAGTEILLSDCHFSDITEWQDINTNYKRSLYFLVWTKDKKPLRAVALKHSSSVPCNMQVWKEMLNDLQGFRSGNVEI